MMDLGVMANMATVIVPVVGAAAFIIEMRVKLLIQQNNSDLIKQINGTYIRRTELDDKLRVAVAEYAHPHHR